MFVSALFFLLCMTVIYTVSRSSARELCKPGEIYLTREVSPLRVPPGVKKYSIVGFFPGMITLRKRYNRSGYTWMEVAKHALEEVNKILARLQVPATLELIIYDTCNSIEIANFELLEILLNATQSSGNKTQQNVIAPKDENLLGFVGPASSQTTAHTYKLLMPFAAPMVGYSATSVSFDNKEIYPLFMRTIPPDNLQAKFIVDLVLKFNWKYVSLIANDNEYGRKGRSELKKLFAAYDICTAVDRLFKYPVDGKEIESITNEVKNEKESSVIILWAAGIQSQVFINQATTLKLYDKTWIVTESVGTNPKMMNIEKRTVQGLLSVVPFSGVYHSFERKFRQIKYEKNASLGLKHFFEYSLKLNGNKLINATLDQYWKDIPLTKNGNIRNAIYTYGYAIKNYITENIQCRFNTCNISPILNRTKFFYQYLQKVTFKGLSGETVSFDRTGNINSAMFHLYSLQPGGENLVWKKIGTWNKKDKIKKTNSNFIWAGNATKQPISKCASNCKPGFYAVPHGSKLCCWTCVRCNYGFYQPTPGRHESCRKCKAGERSNEERTACSEVKERYIGERSREAYIIYAFISSTMCIGGIFLAVFVVHRKTPMVVSSQYHISLLQLISLILLPFCMLLFVNKPTRLICIGRISTVSVLLTFACTFTIVKTQRLIQVFGECVIISRHGAQRMRSIDVWIIPLVLMINVVLLVAFYTYEPFFVTHKVVEQVLHVNCNIKSAYFTQILFILILSLFCGVQAFRARKLPQNYNETTFISFAMFSTSMALIIVIPLHESAQNPTDAMFVGLLLALVVDMMILLVMYSNKVWIILFHKELNTENAFHLNRLRSIQRKVSEDIQRHRKITLGVNDAVFVVRSHESDPCYGLQIHSPSNSFKPKQTKNRKNNNKQHARTNNVNETCKNHNSDSTLYPGNNLNILHEGRAHSKSILSIQSTVSTDTLLTDIVTNCDTHC